MKKSQTWFARFAWFVLIYTLAVILWGAYVRATGSGAGCGSHWPLCNGEILPRGEKIETVIEFFHRVTSGLSGVFVLGLYLWATRIFKRGERIRRAAGVSLAFIIIESLIGAGLVLFEWVALDASVGRAITIVIHLVNTFVLLAAISLTARWAMLRPGQPTWQDKRMLGYLVIALGGTLLIGASGALTALGDTLFPANSLVEGLQQDIALGSHFLIRMRLPHPLISAIVGIYLLGLAGMVRIKIPGNESQLFSRILTLLVLIQLAAGVTNVLLLAPVWMQLVHLLLADGVWIILVLLSDSVLSGVPTRVQTGEKAQSYRSIAAG